MLACTSALAASAGEAGELDEIVVTGLRDDAVAEVPRSVTVITAEDIALAPSNSLVELLAREANLNLRSLTGNDKLARVDVRGMGDTASSNVLVLVDGVRLNSPDLTGADLSVIPLTEVERIEVVRGANVVRYGSGAVGGVINIVTRKSGDGPPASVVLAGGSFGLLGGSVRIGGGGDRLGGSAQVVYSDSSGYRENGELEKLDVILRGDAELSTDVTLSASAQFHDDEFGLPGPISAEAFAGSDAERRASERPNDGGETHDNRYRLGLTAGLRDDQRLLASVHVRDRRNPYIQGYTPLLTEAQQQDEIEEDTLGAELSYELPLALGGGRQELTVGVAASSSDYTRREDGTDIIGVSTELDGELREAGAFAALHWPIGTRWQLSTGYRQNLTRLDSARTSVVEVCDYEPFPGIPPPGIPVNCRPGQAVDGVRDEDWNDSAAEAGMVFAARDDLNLFISLASSFRVPNIDEIAFSAEGLRPQDAVHWDAGLRWLLSEGNELSLTVFRIDTDDEILYGTDPDTGEPLNRNSEEETERTGAELESRWRLLPDLQLLASAAVVHARFAESGGPVPLVPEWIGGLSLRWSPLPDLNFSVGGQYIDTRTDGNDLSGETYPELDSYVVADIKALWRYRAIEWSAGIRNLFDEVAATDGYSGSLYPLPTRSFYGGVAVRFGGAESRK